MWSRTARASTEACKERQQIQPDLPLPHPTHQPGPERTASAWPTPCRRDQWSCLLLQVLALLISVRRKCKATAKGRGQEGGNTRQIGERTTGSKGRRQQGARGRHDECWHELTHASGGNSDTGAQDKGPGRQGVDPPSSFRQAQGGVGMPIRAIPGSPTHGSPLRMPVALPRSCRWVLGETSSSCQTHGGQEALC